MIRWPKFPTWPWAWKVIELRVRKLAVGSTAASEESQGQDGDSAMDWRWGAGRTWGVRDKAELLASTPGGWGGGRVGLGERNRDPELPMCLLWWQRTGQCPGAGAVTRSNSGGQSSEQLPMAPPQKRLAMVWGSPGIQPSSPFCCLRSSPQIAP